MMQQSTNFDWISDILLTLISRSIDKVDNVQEKNSNILILFHYYQLVLQEIFSPQISWPSGCGSSRTVGEILDDFLLA